MVDAHSTPETPTKTCTKCGETKPETEFYLRHRPGHGVVRYTPCKACIRASSTEYAMAHKEQIRAYFQAYRVAHRRRLLAQKHAYNAAHRAEKLAYMQAYWLIHGERIRARIRASPPIPREKIRPYEQAWRRANPEKVAVYRSRRAANKRQAAINDLTAEQWREIKAHYGYRCVYCGRKMQRLTMDHIVPLSKGGNHTASNVVPACFSCNSRKRDRAPLVPVQPLLLTVTKPGKPKKL